MSNFTWFLHKPTDEREQALYQRAYQASFYTTAICLIIVLCVTWAFPMMSVDPASIGLVTLLILAASYMVGWVMLRQEDLVMNATTVPADIRKQTRSYWIFLLVITAFDLIFVVLSPELYLRFIFSYALMVYFSSLSAAFASGKTFPLPVRLGLAIFFPLPTLIWLSVNTGSTAKKIGLVLVLCVAMVISVFGMMIAIRQFVVSPYYIATDAFAPNYTKGQYVLVSYRQLYPTAGQYIMYDTVGEAAKVGQVLAVTPTGEYHIKTADGDQTINQEHLLGTILPSDSALDWLRAN